MSIPENQVVGYNINPRNKLLNPEPTTYCILYEGRMLGMGMKRNDYEDSYNCWFFPGGLSKQKVWISSKDLKLVKTYPASKRTVRVMVYAPTKDLIKFVVTLTYQRSTSTSVEFAFDAKEAERKSKIKYAKNNRISVGLVMSWFKEHENLIQTERAK